MAHKTARSMAMTSTVIRGAYFYIHEKRTKNSDKSPIPEADQKYEFVGLIPKTNNDAMQCTNYRQFSDLAMSAVAAQEEWRGSFPAGGNWPIKDGDDPSRASKYPWQKGCWVINFSGNFAPKVAIMQNGVPTEIPARRIGMQDLYKSGDYCIVSTYAFTYDNKTRGVKFDMEGVLFVGPGEVIGTASRSVDQMFAGVSGATSSTTAPAAGTALPPAMPGQAPNIPATITTAPPAPPAAPPAPSAPVYAAAPPPPAPGMASLPPIPGR
jgi:hypothetical protein